MGHDFEDIAKTYTRALAGARAKKFDHTSKNVSHLSHLA